MALWWTKTSSPPSWSTPARADRRPGEARGTDPRPGRELSSIRRAMVKARNAGIARADVDLRGRSCALGEGCMFTPGVQRGAPALEGRPARRTPGETAPRDRHRAR